MNKAYRHVYKDGIGWVAIAENGSCVSSSKGSGTVSAKTKVEVLKNFFDLRNSVVLNNGFLLKGLFAATLFCGVFVTQGFAEVTQKEILDIQNNGTAVYTDNDGNRMEKIINEEGEVIFADGSILNKADSDGIIHIDGKDYVVPTGTLNKPDTDEFGDKTKLFRVKKDETTGEWRGLTFKELKAEDSKLTMGAITTKNGKFQTVIYDKDKKKWFVHNQASEAQLYQAKKKNGEVAYYAWTSIQKDINGVPLKTVDGYYMPLANATAEANEIKNLGYDIVQVASKNKAERLSLVGIDGKTVKPIKYTKNDQQVKDGKKNIGDNKDGTIRLGNVAKAELDDEAVNLGQLNERLQNVKAKKVPYVSISSEQTGTGSNYNSDGATGQDAIAIGVNAKASTESTIAIGRNAGQSEYIGNSIFIGEQSGKNSKKYDNSTNSWGSVVIGQQSGMNSTGDANLYIGSTTGASHTGSQNIFLGDTAKAVKYNSKDKGEPESTADLVRKKTSGNRNIYIGNQYVHPKDKVPKGSVDEEINDSIAIGTLSNASNSKSIAIGSSSSNKKYGALSIGKTSIAIGSSTTDNNGSTAKGDNSISFGSDTLAIENDSVALGSFSVADRKALSDAEKQNVYLVKNTDVANTVKNTKGAISVGKSGENGFTRQITNLAAGTAPTDAVNVAQLKAGLDSKTKLDGTNLFKDNTLNELNPNFKKDNWRKALDISDANIQKLAQKSVVVANGENTTVAKDTSATGDITYKVNVKLDEYAKSTDIDTKLGDYVKSVTGDDFIKVDATKKQSPALSLDTDKLANDSTFVTNIAGNKVFKNTYVTNDKLADSGFKFTGDDTAKEIEKKLGGTISIKGGANSELSDSNIGVVVDNGSLNVKLAKNLLGLESAEFKKGADTTTVSAEKGVSTTKTLKVTDSNGKTVAEIDNTQIKDADGKAVTNINSAINNLYTTTKGLTSDNALAVKYDSADKKQITLGGIGATDKVAIKNLASAGDINKAENEFNAVNAGDLKTALNGVSSSITNKIDNGNFISLRVSANGGAKDEIKANENIDFTATDGITIAYNASVNKFTFSADINSIANNNVLSNKYAMLDGSNLNNNDFNQGAWRTALGLTNDNIASIFEAGTDISITPNGNKYTIAYTGGGTGGISETKVKEIIKDYIGGDKIVTHNVSEQGTTNNKKIIAAINKINEQGIGFVHVNGGDLTPDASDRSANDSSAKGENAIAIGPRSQANRKNTIALGADSIVNGDNSGAMGYKNKIHAGADGSFAIGNNVVIEKDAKSSLALGENTKVSVAGGVALGSGSVANRTTNLQGYIPAGATADQEKAIKETSKGSLGVVSVGETSADGKTVIASRQITGVAAGTQDSDAVNVAQLKAVQRVSQSAQWIAADNRKFDKNGKVVDNSTQAEAKGVNSVAIGAGSNTKVVSNGKVVERPYTVSVGGINKDGTVTQRTISNVAPGVLNSDAATMGQLRAGLNDVYGKLGEYKKDASAGTASALAVGNLPQATIPGKGMVSLGSGFYDGQSAMAIGLSKMSDSGKWVFKGSASYDSQERAGAALSVGFHF